MRRYYQTTSVYHAISVKPLLFLGIVLRYCHMIGLILILAICIILIGGIKIVTQYERAVVFRLGKYTGTRGPGLIYIIPLIEQLVKVSFRTVTMEIPSNWLQNY